MDASGLLHRDRSFLLTRADFPTQHQGVFDAYLAAAQALANGSKAAKGASPKKPTPNVPDNALTQHNALLKAADDARKVLRDTINVHGCKILLAGCFAAGTKLLTREGWRAVETLREGDEVASRAEHDVYGSVSFRPIEEVFVRTGRVLHLHLSDGQLIRTTPEHPFWVEELGWTPADMLRAGMRLATLGGEWVAVEEAFDTGEYETVYNCRVAEYHTYFVGDETHVLAVWAHNTACSFEFVSGRKVAKDLEVELTKVSATLSAADHNRIVEFISKPPKTEAQYGRVGDYPKLVAWLVRQLRPANGTQPLHASLEASMTAYFKQQKPNDASILLNGYVRTDKDRDGNSFKEVVVAPAIVVNPNDPADPRNKPEIKTKGWISYIHDLNASNNHKDARGLNYREYMDEYERLINPTDGSAAVPKSNKKNPQHGHHIIFKESSEPEFSKPHAERYINIPKAREYSSDAKDILLYYGINPYWGKENLCYAQNYEHTFETIKHMHKKLLDLHNGVGDAVPSAASVTNMLKSFADDWVNHKLYGMWANG